MSLYTLASPRVIISTNSDYSSPEVTSKLLSAYTATYDEYSKRLVQIDTSLTTIDIDEFTTVSLLRVINTHATATLYCGFTSLLGSKTFAAGELTANNAGNPDTLTRSDASPSWKAIGAYPGAFVRLSGGNNTGRYMIWSVTTSAATDDRITLVTDEALTTNGADAGTPTAQIEADNMVLIPAGGSMLVVGGVRPASNLSLFGSAQLDAEVLVCGS